MEKNIYKKPHYSKCTICGHIFSTIPYFIHKKKLSTAYCKYCENKTILLNITWE